MSRTLESPYTPRIAIALSVTCSPRTRWADADVRSDQKSHVEFAGVLGRMFNMFGGKAAREGVTSTVAVKGDRKATMNDATGQIIDLAEEKVYDLDLKKKSYRVTTFAELRRRMDEARKKAEADAQKEAAREGKPAEKPAAADPNAKQVDIDFDVKNTGAKKAINGFDTHETVVTVTVREKGKTLEQGGGMVMTSDMWLASKIPAMKEILDFDIRYAKMLYGTMVAGVSAEQMAQAQAMYPMMKDAIAKMSAEGGKIDGTAIQTTTTMDAVKSEEQVAEEAKASSSSGDSKSSTPLSTGGLLGGLAKKMAPEEDGRRRGVQAARHVHDGDDRSPESGHRRDARRRRDSSRVQGKQVTGFMVQGAGFRVPVQGSGFRVG